MIRALEQRLEETERRFQNMADASPVLLWMSGPDGLCTFFNQTWLNFTGRTLEQEWGVGWAEGVHFEDFQRCMDTYADAFNRRQVFEMEYRLRRHDGVYRWVVDRGNPRYAPDGTFAGYIGSCADITDRKQLELELRQAVRARDEFLSIASHELRTPLTALKLRAQQMVQSVSRFLDPAQPSTKRLQQEAAHSMSQVQRLVDMVDLLLDASRIAEGALRLEPHEVEAGALVSAVAERMAEPAASAGSVLRVERGAPAGGYWDSFRIEQVVTNLIANAIKFGAGKPIEVSVGGGGGRVRIAVRDQGPGISPQDQSRLFQRFARFGSHNYGGFGLGLWIARTIVEAHGGAISVESCPGSGARFTVELPARA
jgi:PAS domain S-box-containing protein